jgi:CheY-like chemotaxis protein
MKLVLIVDDEYAFAEALNALLTEEQYVAICAANGAEALLRMNERRPDVLLVDVMMPGMSGLDLARHLRTSPDFSTIPLIIMSAAPVAAAALAQGAAAFLRKPFDLALLLATLRRICGTDPS